MYILNVRNHFSSAHQLRGYDGLCRNVHGHNWKVRVAVKCQKVDDIGMAIDFGVLKGHLDEIMEYLDHKYLNEIEPFTELNPTSENIAEYIYNELSRKINDENSNVWEVEVWENDNSSCIFTK